MPSNLSIDVIYLSTNETEAAKSPIALLLEGLQPLEATVTRKPDDGGFGHWLETSSLVVGIITSSIAAIKVIYDWVKDKKEEPTETNIVIVIDNRKLDVVLDKQEILNILTAHIEEASSVE